VVKGLRFKYHRSEDKAELLIELSILELTDLNYESWGKLLVIKDQTTFSQMEGEIKRSEHMAAVGRLAAGLAHEIRTPLASMTGSWHMLLSQSFNVEDQNRLMLIIGREMERLESLVEDFLSFAKPSVGRPQAIDLNGLIDDQVHIFKTWKGAEAKIELSLNEIPMVYFDYGQLCQVVFNLIQNALDAAVPGRLCHLRISTSTESLKRGFVTCTISDNGAGISEDNIKRIFEPFFSTKPKGTGLGLAMVWGIISNGNGRISVSSTPNVLTSFTVLFPVSK
jgi:two-component system sensor histidine kinase PilS (NtrC family)